MKGSFSTARLEELPAYLDGPNGQGIAGALGEAQNAEIVKLEDAAKMQSPALCPDDALPELATDFDMEAFPGEDPDRHRARILASWETHPEAGRNSGIEASLRAFGIEDVAVYESFDGHFSSHTYPSSFWVIVGPTMPFAPLLGGFVQTPDTVGGSTATPVEVRAVVRQILKWKNSGAYAVKVILRFPGAILGGVNSIAPFAPPVGGGDYSSWDIGKLVGVNVYTAPFAPGDYYTY